MKSSIILNNSPKCPYCFEYDYDNLKVIDVDLGLIDGEPHYEITMKCETCGESSYYFLDMNMKRRKDVSKDSDRYAKVTKEPTKDKEKMEEQDNEDSRM